MTPFFFQFAHQTEEYVRLVLRQARSRLVEHEYLGVGGKRLGDLDELLVGGAELHYGRLGVEAQADHIHVFAGEFVDLVPVHEAELGELIHLVQHDVFGNTALGDQVDLLI